MWQVSYCYIQSVQKAHAGVEELGEVVTKLEAENASLQFQYKVKSESTIKLHREVTKLERAVNQSAKDKADLQECVDTLRGKINELEGAVEQSAVEKAE